MSNVILLTDVLRFKERLSRCTHDGRFSVDTETGDAYCRDCSKSVSPAHALITLARNFEFYESRKRAAKEEAALLEKWVPTLRAVRNLHRRWMGRKLLPCCPHCKLAIRAEELDRSYTRAREVSR